MPSKTEEDAWKSQTPKTLSPVLRSSAPSSTSDGSSSEVKRTEGFSPVHATNGDALHDAVTRKLVEQSPGHSGPRKWFSTSRLKSSDTMKGEEPVNTETTDFIHGGPLVATTSNDSLSISGTGYSNPFAPSAAEKKALRWGPLNKWGANRPPDDFGPLHVRASTTGFLGEHSSARSSSADLSARSAWDHAVVGDAAASGTFAPGTGAGELSSSEEKRHFRFFSMGKKSAKESSPGNGIWKS